MRADEGDRGLIQEQINFMKRMTKRGYELETFTFDNNGLRSWITKQKI
mgnify:CR=1 FL=1